MQINKKDITSAVQALRRGEVVAYPTEAVYGLGCDPFNVEAVTIILQLKQRPIEKGFILVAASWEQIEPLVEPIEPPALYRVLNTWPGPTTWVFPARSDVPHWISGKHNTVAVRVSAHPIVKALCESFGGPIVSTSANIKGQPPIRDYRTTMMTFGDKVATILDGKVGKEISPTEIRYAITGEIIRSA